MRPAVVSPDARVVRVVRVVRVLALAVALVSCRQPETSTEDTSPAPLPVMSPAALATRASLDLRGVRPSADEIARVEADPSAYDDLVREWMADPRFPERVAELWSQIYLTHTETYYVDASRYDVPGLTQAKFVDSIGREPLEILAEVTRDDLPYTTLVTADWTMADEVTSAIWPIDRPAGDGWVRSRYTDDRPAAGVLATNGLWWRYTSTDSNANRKRANQASRILLCHDYLTRPIEFDRNVNLLDDAAVSDALKTNPACQSCHDSLDPLASYDFGFWWFTLDGTAEISTYHADRERLWSDYTGVAPAYYGEPGDNLADLGRQIAADPRFPECAVQQSFSLLLRREPGLDDQDRLTAIRESFLDGGLTVRALVEATVTSPEYMAGATDDPRAVPAKMVDADLLGSEVEGLTGFRWVDEYGYDLLASDTNGYRTLAGAADGYFSTREATAPNATIVLVQARLAEAAAAYVVDADAADPAHARLFHDVDFTETPDTGRDAMVAQIRDLHLAVFGRHVAADGPEVAANLELWSDLYAIEGDRRRAWAGVLTALLRDPDFLFY